MLLLSNIWKKKKKISTLYATSTKMYIEKERLIAWFKDDTKRGKKAENCKDKGKRNHGGQDIVTKFWKLESRWSSINCFSRPERADSLEAEKKLARIKIPTTGPKMAQRDIKFFRKWEYGMGVKLGELVAD